MTSADRKKQLIAQGAVYRAEVLHAKQVTHASLRPESLARGALQQLSGVALSIFNKKTGIEFAGTNAQTLLPLLLSAVSTVVRKKSLRKVLRGTLIAGGLAAIAAFLLKKKATQEEPVEESRETA